MSIAENKALVAQYLSAWNSGDEHILQEILAPNFIDHAHPDWQPGASALQENMRAFGAAFADVVFAVDDVIGEGELVAFRATIHARHTGQFGPFPPTGKSVAYEALEMIRVADGRIAEIWSFADTLGWVRQLGATLTLPETPQPPSAD